jgi:hypothetical protein
MNGVKCIRLQPGAASIKLKDVPIGVVVSFGGTPIMNILKEKNKIYIYDFSKGETDWYGTMSAAAHSDVTIIRGEIVIKNPDV